MTATTTTTGPTWLGSTASGRYVVSGGIVYLLTSCCEASGKGSANSPTGVVCRACYRPVPSRFGWGELASDVEAVVAAVVGFEAGGALGDLAEGWARDLAALAAEEVAR